MFKLKKTVFLALLFSSIVLVSGCNKDTTKPKEDTTKKATEKTLKDKKKSLQLEKKVSKAYSDILDKMSKETFFNGALDGDNFKKNSTAESQDNFSYELIHMSSQKIPSLIVKISEKDESYIRVYEYNQKSHKIDVSKELFHDDSETFMGLTPGCFKSTKHYGIFETQVFSSNGRGSINRMTMKDGKLNEESLFFGSLESKEDEEKLDPTEYNNILKKYNTERINFKKLNDRSLLSDLKKGKLSKKISK